MLIRTISGIAALALLCGCKPGAPGPVANEAGTAVRNAADPAPNTAASAMSGQSPLRQWLVGTWSVEGRCETDFLIRYNADGTLDNAGEIGTWSVEGNQVTETLTEKFENGGEEPVKVDPPETRSYTVAQGDAQHGTISYQKRSVPMLRC